MVTVAIGALAGWAFSGALVAAEIVANVWGAIALGASLGNLFVTHEFDASDFASSPNYSFGPISNTMSQLVPIFVVYGKNRVAGNIIYQVFDSDKKEKQDLYILIGEGGITSINDVMANDQNPAELDGCSVTTYLDTDSTTHDSRDPSGARPYPDNVALICLTLKAQENLNGTPTITSIVEGMKVWTPGGFAYSRNPIWIILDILCHPRYGMGMGVVDSSGAYLHPNWDKIDYACALAAANYCDGNVEYGPRFQLDFVMDTRRPIRDVLADFLSSCRGYMVQTNKLEIYIDAPVDTYSRSITPGNIVEGSFTFWQAADEDVCNRITVDWIDPDNNYERVTDVFQDSDDIAIRGVVEKSFSLLGVTRSGQVGHMGYYLLKGSMLVRNFCSFGVSFKDCDIQPGEVLTVSFEDFTGWVNKPFRVLSVKDNGNDVMTVTCSEYIPEIYDDSVMEVPVHIDTSLTTNYKPDDVEDLTITEQLETLQDGSYNLIAKITWTPPESYQALELWYRYSSEVAWVAGGTLPKGSTEYYLPCTGNIGDTLYVRVYTVSRLGVRSSGQTTSRILHGDTVPPAAPTNLQGEGGFRLARLTWTDPPDGDLDHIDVYRSITADIAADYEKIGVSARFAQEYIDNGLSVLQTAWYKLKAVDVAGNESEFSAVISVTSESLPATEIPEASIDESKLLPGLAEKIENIDESASSIPAILNALSLDKTMEQGAKAERTLSTKVDEGLAAEATERLKLTTRVNDTMAAVTEESTARAEGDDALSQRITTIGAQIAETAAVIEEETTARIEGDAALSQQIATVSAKADNNAAVIQEESAARADEDDVLSQRITTLGAEIDGAQAAIQEEQNARADGDGALAEQITTLGAQTSESLAAIQQKMTADTSNGVSVTLAAISQDNALAAQASAERTLTVKYNEEVAERLLLAIKQGETQAALEAVNQIVNGPNGLVAQSYIKTDVNGHVAGVGLYNDGNASEFVVVANRFLIANADGSATPIFEINGTTGLAQLIGSLIASGSLTGRELNAAAKMQLGPGGQFIAGSGAIVQIGTGTNAILLDTSGGLPRIRCEGTNEYVEMTSGQVRHYIKYGDSYVLQNTLTQIETGECKSGEWCTLKNYYQNAPQVFISPRQLMSYDADSLGSQVFNLYVPSSASLGGVQSTGVAGAWRFKPIAELQIGEGGYNAATLPESVIEGPTSSQDGLKLGPVYVVQNDIHSARRTETYAVTEAVSSGNIVTGISACVTSGFNAVYNDYDRDGGSVRYVSCKGYLSILYSTNGTTWVQSAETEVSVTALQSYTLVCSVSNLPAASYSVKIKLRIVYDGSLTLGYSSYPGSYFQGTNSDFTIDYIRFTTQAATKTIAGTVNYMAIGR